MALKAATSAFWCSLMFTQVAGTTGNPPGQRNGKKAKRPVFAHNCYNYKCHSVLSVVRCWVFLSRWKGRRRRCPSVYLSTFVYHCVCVCVCTWVSGFVRYLVHLLTQFEEQTNLQPDKPTVNIARAFSSGCDFFGQAIALFGVINRSAQVVEPQPSSTPN